MIAASIAARGSCVNFTNDLSIERCTNQARPAGSWRARKLIRNQSALERSVLSQLLYVQAVIDREYALPRRAGRVRRHQVSSLLCTPATFLPCVDGLLRDKIRKPGKA